MTDRLHLFLVGALVVLLGVGVVLQRRRGAAAPGRRAGPSPTDPSIGRRFRKRRLGCFLSWLILGPAALFLLFADTERFAVASMVTLAALFALVFVAMRCPACGESPGFRGNLGRGLDLNPRKCPGCGAQLR